MTAYARETGVTATALRYHNVYGPRMPRDTPYAGVASISRSALAAGDVPNVFEDGGQRRDFVHVRDVARANLRALGSPASRGRSTSPAARRARSSTWPPRSRARSASSASRRSPASGAGDVRHVFASRAAGRRAARLPGPGAVRRRHGRVRGRSPASIGRLMTRIAIVGHVEWIEFARVDHVPVPGEIVHATEWWQDVGGGGAVAAVQAAKLAGGADFFTRSPRTSSGAARRSGSRSSA